MQRAFYQQLLDRTRVERERFLAIGIIQRALRGDVDRSLYLRYLEQAYHHVRHTCPLLGAALSRCAPTDARLRDALLAYIEEERGHEAWIADDIAALGGDVARLAASDGSPPVRVMVGYAYYLVDRVSPYALLGMVHVLEGLSVHLADAVANALGHKLGGGGDAGFSYLRSHGSLDQSHVRFFAELVDGIEDARAREAVVDAAAVMYGLFGDVFRWLEDTAGEARDAA
ncbi:MAG: iron-containing redox enzyme family protein [Ectothiorhodospiraceae bacterium]|nr:iron-containing redox enzyme family protein [Ectothiorhodospiraceae bacterium]